MNYFDILLAKKLEDDRDPKVEGLSVTENGRYHEDGVVYDPVIVEVPEPTLISKSITANGNYSASADNVDGYSSVSVNVPLPSNAYLLKSIENVNIATFTDGTDNFLKSLEIAIEPVQSGSGEPSPENVRPISGWTACNVTRSGKNLAYSQTNNTVVAHAKKGVTYTLSFAGPNKGANVRKNTSTGDKVATGANPLTFTADEDFDIFLNTWNSAFSNLQVEVGNQATEYEAYNDNIFNIQFRDGDNPLTVYGGSLDVVSGVLTVDRAMVNMGDLTWTLENGIFRLDESIGAKLTSDMSAVANMMCSHYKTVSQRAMGSATADQCCVAGLNWSNGVRVKDPNYTDVASFKQAMSGVQLVYELATPQTIQLTPTTIKSLQGDNNFFASTGEVIKLQYWGKEQN